MHYGPACYATALKLMQIMHQKGLLKRDESRQPHIYRPQAPIELAQSQLLKDFVKRVFEGSTQRLVLQALGTKKASPKELSEITRKEIKLPEVTTIQPGKAVNVKLDYRNVRSANG